MGKDRLALAWGRGVGLPRAWWLAPALVTFILACTNAHAHDFVQGDLVLDHPYAIPSLAGVNNGAAYLRGIKNRGDRPDRLIAASSAVAARVELHHMTQDAGVMRMRAVSAIELPANSVTPLRHNGAYHLMLINLKQTLQDGDHFDLTLNFARAGSTTVKVWVQTPHKAADNTHKH